MSSLSEFAIAVMLGLFMGLICGAAIALNLPINNHDYGSDTVHASTQCVGFTGPAWTEPIQGKSMMPTLEPGDLLQMKAFDSAKGLSIGEVVAAYNVEQAVRVAHRVTSVDARAGTFKMKGDNNPVEDENVYEFKDIEGIVCGDVFR